MEMKTASGWDLSRPAAEIHSAYLVPAMYAQWAIRVTALAEIDSGHKVLDAGCGTGILAQKAADEVGFTGKVTGLDMDPEMLEIARREAPAIEWREGDAQQLPFEDGSFDRVVSQFLLPHVKNRVGMLKELCRVLARGGRAVLAVWAPLNFSPAFHQLHRLTHELGSAHAAEHLVLPWELGHEEKLRSLLSAAGLTPKSINREKGTARFPDPDTIVDLWIERPPVRTYLDDAACKRIRLRARDELSRFAVSGGGLVCSMDATIVTIQKN